MVCNDSRCGGFQGNGAPFVASRAYEPQLDIVHSDVAATGAGFWRSQQDGHNTAEGAGKLFVLRIASRPASVRRAPRPTEIRTQAHTSDSRAPGNVHETKAGFRRRGMAFRLNRRRG